MRLLNRIRKYLQGTVVLSDYINLSNYYCIELVKKENGVYLPPQRYLENTNSLMKLLSVFDGKSQSAWDVTGDGKVLTDDLMVMLGGFGQSPMPNPKLLDFDLLELFGEFGEGNHWFNPTTFMTINADPISFVWYHTTPYDETDVFIKDNPNSFALDIVMESGDIYTFTYVRK